MRRSSQGKRRNAHTQLEALSQRIKTLNQTVAQLADWQTTMRVDLTDALDKIARHLGVDLGRYGDKPADEPLYPDARLYAIGTGIASASMLQRKFGIGYARATRLMDLLEQTDVIEAARGSRPRRIIAMPESS